MHITYFTDLHGDISKYDRTLKIIERDIEDTDIIINGGDMLPKHGNLFKQDKFIREYLDKIYFPKIAEFGFPYFCMLGNDDLAIFDKLFEKICNKYPNVFNIPQKWIPTRHGYNIIGFNWVVDYPFQLKDRCLMDDSDFVFEKQLGPPLFSTRDKNGNGCWNTGEFPECLQRLPTIKEKLEGLYMPEDNSKSIYVIHMPPSDGLLDVCADERMVGSKAIFNFLKDKQPLLSLHGHIHESPDVSGEWYTEIGNTLCIQPGQRYGDFVYVYININENNNEFVNFYRMVE